VLCYHDLHIDSVAPVGDLIVEGHINHGFRSAPLGPHSTRGYSP